MAFERLKAKIKAVLPEKEKRQPSVDVKHREYLLGRHAQDIYQKYLNKGEAVASRKMAEFLEKNS